MAHGGTDVPLERKHKICPKCRCYMPETEILQGECDADEDINIGEFCYSFERKERINKGRNKSRNGDRF